LDALILADRCLLVVECKTVLEAEVLKEMEEKVTKIK
jgi:hypothetical protein